MNHLGQRYMRWPFLLFVACSSVQNFSKVVCNSAFVCGNSVRIAHRRLCLCMPKSILSNGHRRTDLIQECGVPVPEGVEATLRDAERFQQWLKPPFSNQAMIPWRAVLGREQQPQRVRSPGLQAGVQVLHEF